MSQHPRTLERKPALLVSLTCSTTWRDRLALCRAGNVAKKKRANPRRRKSVSERRGEVVRIRPATRTTEVVRFPSEEGNSPSAVPTRPFF